MLQEMKKIEMRLFLFLSAVCLCLGGLRAQEAKGGIDFVEGKTFAEVLEMAKKSGKDVFVDCYTSWCGPCRMLATQVFPQKIVGDYFNAKFVNVKIDMEKGEGPELHKRFGVRAFPTLLFLDSNGKELNRIVGAERDAAVFVEQVKNGLGEKGAVAMTARYDGGERDTTFLMDYLEVLEAAYDIEKKNEVSGVLLKDREADLLSNPRLYQAFLKYNNSPLTETFRYVLDHKGDFEARYGKEALERKISSTWMAYPRTFVSKDADGKAVYDKDGMAAYVKEMKKNKVENYKEIVLMSDINVDEAMGDWEKYVDDCSRYIKKYKANDMLIYNWALRVQKNCKDDAKVKARVIGWLEDRIAQVEAEKAKLPALKEGETRPMNMMDFSPYYKKMIKELEQ